MLCRSLRRYLLLSKEATGKLRHFIFFGIILEMPNSAFQEPRHHLGTISTSRQRPRLPLPGRRHRHPLRRLRPVCQSRLRGRRHLPRHPRLRCRQPGQMVAARRPRTLPRRLRTAGARRLRRQQRPTHPLLQVCTPDAPRRPATTSRSPSVTIPAAPPSGTPSTIACSARSARTGPATRCAATRRSSTTSVPPPPTPGCA